MYIERDVLVLDFSAKINISETSKYFCAVTVLMLFYLCIMVIAPLELRTSVCVT